MQENMENEQAVKFSVKIWSRLYPYVKKVRGHLAAVLIFMFLSAVMEAAYPLFTSRAVNSFIIPRTAEGLWSFILLFFALILFNGATAVLFFTAVDRCGDAPG
jgi:ATP-binding cassette subfamily B protein